MRFVLRYRPEVVDDLRKAAEWYDARHAGLAAEFLNECRIKLTDVANRPQQGTRQAKEVRSVRIRRFPYVIHFRIEGETVVVLAILHGGRDPSTWKERG